ncbi:hypothetical protein JW916_02275 [Candidatus Sumerlaeota bacterium]|nr:hypothetical protein [Candidatus Sumerlaeota bacterium]
MSRIRNSNRIPSPADENGAPARLHEPRNTFCVILLGSGFFAALLGAFGSRDSSNSLTMAVFIVAGIAAMLVAVAGVDNWRDRTVFFVLALTVSLYSGFTFASARRRAAVGAIHEDMLATAAALAVYFRDHGRYPESTDGPESVNGDAFLSFRVETESDSERPRFLPTYRPGAFRTSGLLPNGFFRDPFAPPGKTFHYFSAPGCYLLWSPGPDGVNQLGRAEVEDMSTWKPGEGARTLRAFEYDPTNGGRSAGDIVLGVYP